MASSNEFLQDKPPVVPVSLASDGPKGVLEMAIRTEINSQGQVDCASSVALRPKMSHIAATAAASIMLVAAVTFVSGQTLSAPTNEFPNTIVLSGARSAEGIAIGRGSIFYASDF